MTRPSQIDAIQRFLSIHTHYDLAKLYSPGMEVQVNVAQDHGVRVDRDYKGRRWQEYTDNITSWKPIRIPYNANNEPTYDLHKEMTYDLSEHAEGIGLSGWNWINKQSIWVGFDFDSLIGHSQNHAKRLNETELQEIKNKINNIPWVTTRKSTSGRGLHLYIFFDPPITTNNHNEHAALARATLGYLSLICNYNLESKVDAMGHILWVWHRKIKDSINKDGLKLIKQGIGLEITDILSNWKNHIPVIVGRKHKTLPSIIEDNDNQDIFEMISGQRSKVKLDDEHYKLINYLKESRFVSYWDSDRWMLVTHSYALKEAFVNLSLRGKYDTISEGNDIEQNCFCFPLPRGSWVVRRFTKGVAESPIWDQDNVGFTRCYLNKNPDLYTVSKIHGGMENKSGSFVFNEASEVVKAIKDLNIDIDIPDKMYDRKARIKGTVNNKLIIEIEAEPNKDSANELEGWFQEGKYWQKIFYLRQDTNSESEIFNYDNIIRHIISEDSKDLGWYVKNSNEGWHSEAWQHVRVILEGPYSYSPRESKIILGSNIIKPWQIVNRPFKPEYPGERLWNRDAAQFRYRPTTNKDNLTFPTWLKILSHIGKNLDYVIKESDWGKKNAILTGADYLKCWIASLFQDPDQPLPYLFFYGPENTGKSIFHEALSLLITRGYVRADSTLKSSNNFNGELEGGIICIVEETDLRKDKVAANRIKDYVTAIMLPIHAKNKQPYLTLNTSHWIQCSNDIQACPIFGGDTRITMIKVDELDQGQEIPKRQMIQMLESEASDFLSEILNLEIPIPSGRLNIPVIITPDKQFVQESNRTPIEEFIEEKCYYSCGEVMLFRTLYEQFVQYLDPQEVIYYTINKLGKSLPPKFPKGRLRKNINWHIGNISFTPPDPNKPPMAPLIKIGDYLEPDPKFKEKKNE